jgi:CubicO group peptidase (beta-lactamase class C family)
VERLTPAEHLSRAARLAAEVGAAALVVTDRERVLLAAGEPATAVHCRSIRKSLLGALFGRPVRSGALDLDATLADLDIDDGVPPGLTDGERAARVRDLLTCRSGVYHPSNHQTPAARAALPPRGAHRPGTFFLYNNWDFNALGTILERALGRSLFDEFAETIAGPTGMQDFDLARQGYATQPFSEHRTYAFHISTRDLARFGQLYLNHGRHGDRDVIPAEWVTDSTRAHTPTGRGPDGRGPAYGYLWWVAHDGQLFAGAVVPDGSYAAYGMGSQFLLVVPALERVIALLADPTRPGGADAVPRRPKLAELVHHASAGAGPLQL